MDMSNGYEIIPADTTLNPAEGKDLSLPILPAIHSSYTTGTLTMAVSTQYVQVQHLSTLFIYLCQSFCQISLFLVQEIVQVQFTNQYHDKSITL